MKFAERQLAPGSYLCSVFKTPLPWLGVAYRNMWPHTTNFALQS